MNREINIGAVNPNACAACKHQRKKCDESCELAPYFPASRYGEFQHAQKLFGISNIQKIINSVQPNQRHAAAESILMEGNIRYNDPVHGCVGVVCRLKSQIALYQSQLNAVHQQLNILREREKQKHFEGLTKGSAPSSSSPFAAPTLIQNDFDAFNFQPSTPPTHLQAGIYNYQSTIEEGEDVKPFDMQGIDPMPVEYPYQIEQALTCFDEPGNPK
ncbi:LOB domain-containing protein 4-like [Mangifera indica]|uniref:LOB domain-containing protein 4-like n=1 Tax=Mangifera indica TaxID=29780 RepID=UPI001CFA540F|nr:LOB domain-containing protein 4-like [Mangifera indica]